MVLTALLNISVSLCLSYLDEWGMEGPEEAIFKSVESVGVGGQVGLTAACGANAKALEGE